MSEKETVKLEIELPKTLSFALDWYVQRTHFWVSNEYADKSRNELINYIIEIFLKGEARSPSLIFDWLKIALANNMGIETTWE